jgi:hypothetical protein
MEVVSGLGVGGADTHDLFKGSGDTTLVSNGLSIPCGEGVDNSLQGV